MNRDELIETACRILALDPDDSDERKEASNTLDAFSTLVEADVRERIAAEIEVMDSFAHGNNEISKAHLIGYGAARRIAARIARGADQ